VCVCIPKSFCFQSCLSCYLALGEVEAASQYFKMCLQSGADVSVDRKISVEASDGLQKAQV
jgi:DnaJ homolog subfamily C member 7